MFVSICHYTSPLWWLCNDSRWSHVQLINQTLFHFIDYNSNGLINQKTHSSSSLVKQRKIYII